MSEFNFKSQICTTREQSEKLLALGLKKETADCNLTNYSLKGKGYRDDWQVSTFPYCEVLEVWNEFAKDSYWELIPAWSLDRLREMINKSGVTISFVERDTSIIVERYGVFQNVCEIWDNVYDNICDAVEWLIKEGYFNKEYLI